MIDMIFSTVQSGSQLKLFGMWHICLLLFSFTALNYMVKHQKQSIFFEKTSTLFVLTLQLLVYGWYIIGPESLWLKGLPLYTCRLVLYLFIAGIFFGNKTCIKLGSYWGFYGGIAGLIFPTIFKYPFPHILQITTPILHVYIMLVSGNYLFVKKIGMDKKDTKMCCYVSVALLTFNLIFNIIFDANYTSTFKMPMHLVNLGLDIPAAFCYIAVVSGYIAVTIFQHYVVDNYTKKREIAVTRVYDNK